MNSTKEEVHVNLVLSENTSSTENQELSTPDNNANLNASTSKGAIPKNTSATKLLSSSKKPGKLNNNVDEPNLSFNHQLKERSHQNGFSECVSNQVPNSYSSDMENYSSERFWKSEKLEHEEAQFLTLGDLQTFNIPSASQYEKIKDNFNDYNLYRRDLHLSDSSNDENELLSISDDGCVYTFKGDQVADLPSSFFSLDIPLQPSPDVSIQNRQKNNTSPEMDYLEMDFDPGPSGDADSDTGLNEDMDNIENLPNTSSHSINIQENKIIFKDLKTEPDLKNSKDDFRCISQEGEVKTSVNQEVNITTSSQLNNSVTATNSNLLLEFKPIDRPVSHQNAELITQIRSLKLPWLDSPNRYNNKPSTIEKAEEHAFSLMSCSSEYNSPSDKENYVCYENFNISKSCNSSPDDLNAYTKIRKVMLWSEEEAIKKQISQIGVSACGATAVLNVLKALRFPISLPDKTQTFVKTRLRENSSPLLEYLLSRSVAGCTHEDIINGLSKASNGEIYSRFFHMYPERNFDLSCFLRFWMKNDAVPIATLNLQKCSNYKNSGTIPDAWHHQMIFGISSKGIHLTNPLECIEIAQIWPQLCSESILLIKREDILARWNQKTDLPRLMTINHKSWRNLNVVGQVANMVRESRREFRPGFTNTSHITIPAAYSSGITVALKKSNPLYPLLRFCDELPLLYPLRIKSSSKTGQ